MTTVKTNQSEGDILAIIRELEATRPAVPVAEKNDPSLPPDPVALRDNIKNKLEFVSIVEKTQLSHLVEGSFGGKTIAEVKRDLNAALDDLDLIIESAS